MYFYVLRLGVGSIVRQRVSSVGSIVIVVWGGRVVVSSVLTQASLNQTTHQFASPLQSGLRRVTLC